MSLWRIKDDSVQLHGVCPQIMGIIGLAAAVWAKHGADELVVTSGIDGRHSETSLHYTGHAVDFRSRNLPSASAKRAARDELRERLRVDYDVVLEALGEPNEHVHLEWQPKRR